MAKINKRKLWNILNKKLNYSFHNSHTLSIINLFIEKMMAELENGKSINIINFGKFDILKTKPKKIYDISKKKILYTNGNNKIRFTMDKKLKKEIKNNEKESYKKDEKSSTKSEK